ncbi:hypothetical protein PACTADRAFT_48298 [Pachysolen tannophilus NRRL Y-2460]|uniref:EamA domain-containing protein n=1 Tax=Pachysolen tannophilus NRRL Y-2460 TaxID=669874 RepID=A0A1E4U3I2_PACTA|nr:hypothetical protein PACTADRAFT_48298 [Pachysolen tannophilus NRRL Y-2460]
MVLICKLIEQDKDFKEPINPFQIIAVRMVLTVVCCHVYVTFIEHRKIMHYPFGPREIRNLLIYRSISGFIGLYSLYYSLQYISLSTSTVINFLAPVVTVWAACVYLGERYTLYEAFGGLCSIVGMTLVIRPSFLFPHSIITTNTTTMDTNIEGKNQVESNDSHKRFIGIVASFCGVLSNSLNSILQRSIGDKCHPIISVQYFSTFSAIFSTIALCIAASSTKFSMTPFQMMTTLRQWLLFIGIGFAGFSVQFCWSWAISKEEAGRLVLLTYFQIAYSIFWEFVIWGYLPSLLTWLGFLIIIASALLIIYLKPQDSMSEEEITSAGIALEPSNSTINSTSSSFNDDSTDYELEVFHMHEDAAEEKEKV